jgi:anti-anti-sigma regulatory factor
VPAGESFDMHVKQYDSGAEHVVAVWGRVTIDSSPNLRLLLLECVRTSGYKTLTVDFSEALGADPVRRRTVRFLNNA